MKHPRHKVSGPTRRESTPWSAWLCAALIAPIGITLRLPVDTTFAEFDSVSTDTTLSQFPYDSTTTTASSKTAAPTNSGKTRTTKFTLGGGGGRYYREFRGVGECASSQAITYYHEFGDVGAEIDHQHGERHHLGVRGGYVHETAELVSVPPFVQPVGELGDSREINTYYANPYISYEWDDFGLGAGMLISSRPLYSGDEKDDPFGEAVAVYPSAHIRLARGRKFYLLAQLWEGVPIYSGGGQFTIGFGGRPFSSLDLYGAYCAEGPYEEESFLGRVSFDINQSWSLMTTVHLPSDFTNEFGPYEDDEGAVSLGVSYRLVTTK